MMIKVILSSIAKIGLIVYIKDPKEDITTISHFIRSDVMSIINLNTSQISI